MHKTSGHLPYYAESMFPPMEMDEHRADRQKLEARNSELGLQPLHHLRRRPHGGFNVRQRIGRGRW